MKISIPRNAPSGTYVHNKFLNVGAGSIGLPAIISAIPIFRTCFGTGGALELSQEPTLIAAIITITSTINS